MASHTDRVALVTGGAAGIGRAAAIAFARSGARVGVADVDEAGGNDTVAMIRELGGEALFVSTDVSDPAAAAAMVDRTVERFGRLDCAFNNAGVLLESTPSVDATGAPAWDEAVFDRTWRINTRGVMLCMKHEIARMLRQGGGGAIVNTSSVEGLQGTAGHPAYSASKHAVIGLTRSAALEVGRHGIRINAVCPGVIRTPMADDALRVLGQERLAAGPAPPRPGEPEEGAHAAGGRWPPPARVVARHALAVDGGMLA